MTTQLCASTTFDPTTFISLHQGQPMTTSLKVAEAFGKRHDDVLKKVRGLSCSAEFNARNFAEVEYTDVKGEKRPAWEMTKDGFIFVVMGFTGAKAAAVKEAYINAFNRMAEQLYAGTGHKTQLTDDELHALTWLWRAADRMMDAVQKIHPLLEVAEHKEAGRYYSIIHEYAFTLNQAKRILADKTQHIHPSTHNDRDWERLIPHLRSHNINH